MKNKLFLAAGILMLMPLTAHAQGFIKRAFNVLITSGVYNTRIPPRLG